MLARSCVAARLLWWGWSNQSALCGQTRRARTVVDARCSWLADRDVHHELQLKVRCSENESQYGYHCRERVKVYLCTSSSQKSGLKAVTSLSREMAGIENVIASLRRESATDALAPAHVMASSRVFLRARSHLFVHHQLQHHQSSHTHHIYLLTARPIYKRSSTRPSYHFTPCPPSR
jgi:hypothetical protein